MFWPFKRKQAPAVNHAAVASYYPHWVARDGELSPKVLNALAPDTILAVHHTMSVAAIGRILNHPANFVIAWYAESNVEEEDDASTGTPVLNRIAQAKTKQKILEQTYLPNRFADLIELDAAREKYEGEHGSKKAWASDADFVSAANLKYIAKSPTLSEVLELQRMFGRDFVARVVYEDVTGGPDDGYFTDALDVVKLGIPVTLVVHEGAYGGFPGTSKTKALSVITTHFNKPNVEAYHGKPSGFEKLKSFG